MNLEDKVAIVTGASRGVGKQIAIELATRGADVVVAARTVEPRRRLPGTIGETVDAVEALGRRAIAVQADVSVEEDLLKVVDAAVTELGRIDVLVNNAAYTSGKAWGAPLAELSRNDWHRQFATNLDSAFTLVQAVVPHMEAQGGGVIVNITSGAGDLVPGGGGGGEESVMGTTPLAYASSKAALNRFANAVAGQLRPLGIAIVNVEPGFVRTEMVDIMVEGGFDASLAIPTSQPATAVINVITRDDPMELTGQIISYRDLT